MNKSPDLKQQVTVLKRELSIEASLEKVRTNAMTMKRPDDMLKICKTISQQLHKLGVQEIRNVQTAIINPDKGTYLNYEYYSKHNKLITTEVAYTNHPMSRAFVKKMLGGSDEFFKKSLKGKKVQDWYNFQKKSTNQFADKFLLNASSLNYYWYSLGPVALGISTYEPLNKGEQELIVRFRNVFELSYRRFLDIQKAEAQAREAQIQLALERVRARTMAMQKSEELPETSHLLFEQMKELGEPVEQLTIGIVNEENNVIEISATLLGDTLKKIYSHSIEEPYMMAKVYRAWKKQQKTLVVELRGDELNAYNQYRNELTNSKMFPTNLGKEQQRIVYAAFFSKGMLALGSHETRPPESLQLLVKFASVFDLTYTRFLDLQKAEAQAREAQIETAMEKVRSRSLAMQRPEELIEVAELLRKEMGLLGVEELETSSIYIIDNENKKADCWYAIKDVRKKNTKLISDEMTLILPDTWVGKEMWKFYQSANEQASILMKGEQRREWINYCAKHSKVLQGYYGNEIPERTYHLVKFNGGYMGAASPGDISKESWDLLKRATAVFSLAYTRFKDLQDAAARAREAQIELALERVRSRSMAMHKSDELKEVIRLVLEQFIHLKINAEHAGFYIDYKAHDDMHIWLADPNIEPFFTIIPYFDTPTWNSFLEAKAKGITLHTDLLDFKEKNKFYQSLFKIFTIPDEAKKFYLQCKGLAVSTVLLDNVGLYIENFSAIPYTDEENAVLIRFGKVFQQTYTRFLDLEKAEAQAEIARLNLIQIQEEKQKAETALAVLQTTQKQLIQAEKMASLGELTAGIAHEIQNPLNFVNNFSEVSKELVTEMKDELATGNTQIAIEIADDLVQNLEKINHHGQRAAAIVKGMLQHSRSSSGVKEPTDINALCDEYLRLAYHGLRAKDKSFNAKFDTSFDESIGKINVMPQELGRVILNLINNAFYAVDEKKKQASDSYEPTVIVSTKKSNGKVEISVKDNGNGIPQKILDKIFQPFFTTKPTGQGTGLGLSLSYDIVKAHSGELKVETKENIGTSFIIILSV